MQYLCSKCWIGFCLVLALAGCNASQNTVQAPLSEVSSDSLVTPNQAADVSTGPSATEAELWTKLMEADEETYFVLFRHAIAPGTGDPTNFQLDACSTQRNLSDAGRQQAKEIGEAFRNRNIPVIKVLSSQWCRCLETAELMDVAPVEPFPQLNSFFQDRSTAESQTAQIKNYITANESTSGVVVMVTHQVNITAISNIFPQSGSAVVIQSNDGQLNILGQVLEDG